MCESFEKYSYFNFRLIREASSLLVIRIEDIFDEISEAKRKLNDYTNEVQEWKDYISREWQNAIRNKQREFTVAELKTKSQLSTLLQNIRSGQVDEVEMEKLLDSFECENPCSLASIERYLMDNRQIQSKIEILSEFDRSINLLKEFTSIEDKLSKLHDKDVYLLHISDQWQNKDRQNCLKHFRFFKHLMHSDVLKNDDKSDKNGEKTVFIVIDYDLHHYQLKNDADRADKCSIYYAKSGTIQSKDYYEYTQSKSIDLHIYDI